MKSNRIMFALIIIIVFSIFGGDLFSPFIKENLNNHKKWIQNESINRPYIAQRFGQHR